ncbi:MAG: alpha/beta hydrolase, partial [Stenotrophomonas sp.]
MNALVTCLLAAVAAVIAVPASASAASSSFSRGDAVRIVADMRRVVADKGVERLEKVRIGGIDQWVSIRGNDRRNPVLLMLHGGPGWVAMPTSWYFQRGWEEYFTVVQWDQRGAGKTYLANDPKVIAPTMTRQRMVADAEEMVAWLRTEFGKDRIFVLGHSWGSYLGLELAQRRPEWLHAYIGIGQITHGPESERRGWAWTLEQARRDGNAEAEAELLALAPYASGHTPVPLADLFKQRKWLNHYGGMVYNRKGGDAEAAAITLSPEYTEADVAGVWKANEFSTQYLLSEVLTLDMGAVRQLRTPVFLLLGRHDHNVSSALGATWFQALQAPRKQLVWF